MAPKWCFVVEISVSMKCIPKYPGEGARSLEPYDQVVKVGEGWGDWSQCSLVVAGLTDEKISILYDFTSKKMDKSLI